MDNNVNINASMIPMGNPGIVKKLIVADYRDKCNLCFEDVVPGDKIAWYGKGFGVRHFDCYIKRDTLLTNEEFDSMSDW